ncbi:peptidoglycan recognition protein family protein [Spirosoma endophyticum]|uniref:N-acetylmuramoyl-L-alanine amidase n=1 Tax=Spirosoma endophyticum TaxID=662367 RepID=A0A1I1XL01_9BACT|nr:peptidoglycan recognition family protein [Spirosoma endophyticum]SFE08037.1 N-acetylmuramoyl-L-alanine amidase [Spirosoma endophyticum]
MNRSVSLSRYLRINTAAFYPTPPLELRRGTKKGQFHTPPLSSRGGVGGGVDYGQTLASLFKHLSRILPFAALIVINSCVAQKSTFRLIDKPIIFDEERKKLSIDYLAQRHGIQQADPFIKPKMIVLHWTSIPTLEATFDVFNPSVLPGRPDLQAASRLNTSVPFLVDRDGTIFRLLPDTTFARHCIGLNYCAIGIENIGNNDLTKAQIKANIQLVRYLKRHYKGIEYLIGHYEYKDFIGTPLWKETDPNYLTGKTDPGESFMRKVRKQVKDLNLKGSPRDAE